MKFEEYSKTFLHFYSEDIPPLVSQYFRPGDSTLVDMGAGDGALLVALMRHGYFSNPQHITAVELSPERCERLKRYLDINVYRSDVTEATGIPPSSQDYVICTQVIEHVDEKKLLTEIKRVLKDGGILYIASLTRRWYSWWYYRTADGKWAIDPTHLREYESSEQFKKVISDGGFEVLELRATPLRLSVIEFLLRRLIVPVFKPSSVHDFFLKHPFFDALRRHVTIRPPGYDIVEVVARKPA
jgi:2-polyprenyl-3-methyl-5-hydroxy-6-metoxy-1,4-benzoquinol methylase